MTRRHPKTAYLLDLASYFSLLYVARLNNPCPCYVRGAQSSYRLRRLALPRGEEWPHLALRVIVHVSQVAKRQIGPLTDKSIARTLLNHIRESGQTSFPLQQLLAIGDIFREPVLHGNVSVATMLARKDSVTTPTKIQQAFSWILQ